MCFLCFSISIKYFSYRIYKKYIKHLLLCRNKYGCLFFIVIYQEQNLLTTVVF